MAKRAKSMCGIVAEGTIGGLAMGALFTALTGLVAGGAAPAFERVAIREIHFTPLKLEAEKVQLRPEKPQPPIGRALPPCPDCTGLGREPFGRPGRGPIELVGWHPGTHDRVGGESHEGVGIAIGELETIPLVRIPPEYPAHARGDGSVLVQFDVTAAGTVANARVIEATPRGVFEKAALQAISRWRYRPAVHDGRAVERRGLQVRLRFALEKA